MQIPPSEVAAPHLEFLVSLGVLQLFCEDCHWPMKLHPIDWYPSGFMGFVHGGTPVHCDGVDPYFSSRDFNEESPNKGGVHDCIVPPPGHWEFGEITKWVLDNPCA